VAVSGLHRKQAMRLLRNGTAARSRVRPERRVYDDAVREALILIWEASDRICGKRLKPLVPILIGSMERHGHLQLAPEIRIRLFGHERHTIDRSLGEVRQTAARRNRRQTPVSSALRRSVPICTFSDWKDPPRQRLECAPLLAREQKLLSEVVTEVRRLLPFDLLGFSRSCIRRCGCS